jgi:hypothetical protein
MFDRTRKPIQMWFRAMWHIASQEGGASASDLKRLLGLNSYQTAWAWLHRLRRAMVRPGRYRLTGPVHFDVVEIAGSGEAIGSGGRRVWVAIAAQARSSGGGVGRVRLAVVPEGWQEYVAAFLEGMVAPGNTVITPAWPWSDVLWHPDYTRRPCTGEECWLPDLIAGRLGPWLLKTYRGGVGIAHLDYYLDEFAFRYTNEGRSPGCLWGQLVQNALMVKPVRRDHLKAPSRRQIDSG